MRYPVILVFAALAACGGRAATRTRPVAADAAAEADSAARPALSTITVDNRSWMDVVLYAVCDGMRHRLGMVGAAASRSFALPPQALRVGTELRFVADPVGNSPFTSERVLVQPGQLVHWTLESELARSSLLVR